MIRVIGLDPSLTGTGIAAAGWSVAVGSTGNVIADTYAARLARISGLADRVIDQIGQPDLVVLEAPAFDARSTSAHDRAGLWWKLYGRLIGRGIPVATVTTGGLKKYATGKGAAKKNLVVEQVTRRLGHIWDELGGDDNRADAIVLCAMGHDALGQPLAPMPATHRAALAAVAWPEIAAATAEQVPA